MGVGQGPRWAVTITAGGAEHAREVVAQNEGGAALVALGALLTGTAGLREHGPGLAEFTVRVAVA